MSDIIRVSKVSSFTHLLTNIIIHKRFKYWKYLNQAMRKCVFCHIWTTKAQISLRIRAVWSAPLLFAAKIDTSSLYIRNFKILAGLCSWAGQSLSCLVGDSRRHIFSWRGSFITIVQVCETVNPTKRNFPFRNKRVVCLKCLSVSISLKNLCILLESTKETTEISIITDWSAGKARTYQIKYWRQQSLVLSVVNWGYQRLINFYQDAPSNEWTTGVGFVHCKFK